MGIPNLPQDFATEWRRVKELALAAFTAANQDKILIGKIDWFAGPASNVPDGWLVCDGQAVSRTDHADLFGQIGTAWGNGDGSTTFNVPDLRDRTLIGSEGSLSVGDTGGSTSTSSDGGHDHTNPSTGSAGGHSHSNPRTNILGNHSHTNPSTGDAGSHTHSVGSTDSAGSHGHGSAGGHSHTTGTADASNSVSSGVDHSATPLGHTHGSTGSAGGHSHGSAGGHSHGNPATSQPSEFHDHSVGNTGSDGAHDHFVDDTGTESDHSHTQGNTGTEAGHSHTHEPPYAALLPIIRAGG